MKNNTTRADIFDHLRIGGGGGVEKQNPIIFLTFVISQKARRFITLVP